MYRIRGVVAGFVMVSCSIGVYVHAQGADDATIHAVSYVEAMPSARTAMVAALRQYRDASRNEAGYLRLDVFEQAGRPDHFAVVETWADQRAFDAHGAAENARRLRTDLQPLRASGYDERPYRTLTVATARPVRSDQAVYVVTHVDTVPGAQVDAPGLLRRLAEASRAEPGCVRFDVVRSSTRPNHFTVIEGWESKSALEAHAVAQHTRQYRDALQPITGSPFDERVYRSLE